MLWLAAAIVLAAGPSRSGPARALRARHPSRSPSRRYTLPNGLTVITSLDRTTPTVAVNMWYHVGSKNEAKGRTGFAHLFEHVMFTGSGHVPYGLHDKLTEGVGGSNNGTTSNDRTTYYETVPSNYLESALWMEADRMGFLLDSLDLAKLNAQRDIVKNERRQGVDNQPYGRAVRDPRAVDLSGDAPVLLGCDRQHGGPVGRDRRGRQELLPALLRAEQRLFSRSSATSTRPRRRPGSRSTSAISRAASPSRGRRWRRSRSTASAGWSTRTACSCRGSTCSGRPSARSTTTVSRSTCSGPSCPAPAPRASPRRSSTTSRRRPRSRLGRTRTKTSATS